MKRELTYQIFIDDKLRPIDVFNKTFIPKYKEQFVVFKSFGEFVEYVQDHFKKDGSYPDFISFDYLLTDVQLQVTEDYSVYQNEESYKDSGLECAKWIIDFCRRNNLPIPKYMVHDTNSSGKRKIDGVFKNPSSIKFIPEPVEEKTPVSKPSVVKTTVTKLITELHDKLKGSENIVENIIPVAFDPDTNFQPCSFEKVKVKTEKPLKVKKSVKVKTEKPVKKINTKSKDKEIITEKLISILSGKNLSKKEIDEILIPMLSDIYTPVQKKTKIENVMWDLKLKNIIVNEGTVRVPSWKLTEKS